MHLKRENVCAIFTVDGFGFRELKRFVADVAQLVEHSLGKGCASGALAQQEEKPSLVPVFRSWSSAPEIW